jgi:L-lactate dehydrogenase
VFSTGTSLDTARMRRTVADLCNIAPQSVIGFAMGEHGDSSMVPFSNLTIFGKNYKHLREENPERFGKLSEKVITDQTHMRGMDIIEGKGSTEFGIGTALAEMAKAVLMDEHRILPASTLLEGEYGQTNVHAGVPCIIGRKGIEQVVELKLTDEELKQFENSCNVIKQHMVE